MHQNTTNKNDSYRVSAPQESLILVVSIALNLFLIKTTRH